MNWIQKSMSVKGSTRSVGLLRLLWGLLLWARWADELLPFRVREPAYLLLSVCFFFATTAMVVGIYSRASSLLTGLICMTMVFIFGHQLGRESWTHHHTTFLAVVALLIALTPCGKSFSLDRYLAMKRSENEARSAPKEEGNLWAVRLIALQLSSIYFWGAWDKTRWSFLNGARIEQPIMYLYFGSDFPGEWFHYLAVGIAWSSLILEYGLAVGLWFRRLQPFLMPIGLLFHAGLYYFLPVTVFSLASMTAYLAYLEPQSVHRAIDRLLGLKEHSTVPSSK